MKTFRIRQSDTIKATISSNRNLLASIFDSGFSSIKEVKNNLISKIKNTNYASEAEIMIFNQDKNQVKHLTIKID